MKNLIQWKTSFAILIVLTGTSIGANDFIKYETGKATLSSRTEYCQFIEKNNSPTHVGTNTYQTLSEVETLNSESDLIAYSKIWNLKKILAAYRAKRIAFNYLPQSVLKVIVENQLRLITEKEELEKNLKVVLKNIQQPENASVLNRQPGNYTQWQLQNEWPLQVKILKERLRQLENRLSHLQKKTFTDNELYELITQSKDPITEQLMIEVRIQREWVSSSVLFYPVWVIGNKTLSASEVPWFEVQKSFLPKYSLKALAEKKVPEQLHSYLQIAARATDSLDTISKYPIQFHYDGRVFLKGSPKSGLLSEESSMVFTSPTDLAIEGFLDLACFY